MNPITRKIYAVVGSLVIAIGGFFGGGQFHQMEQPFHQMQQSSTTQDYSFQLPGPWRQSTNSENPFSTKPPPEGTVVILPDGTKLTYRNGGFKVEPPPDEGQKLEIREERVIQIENWDRSDPRLKNQELYGEHIEIVKLWIHEDPGLIKDIAALGLQKYIPDTLE